MQIRAVLVIAILLCSATLTAQHEHSHKHEHFDEPPPQRSNVACALQVTLVPDSALARGMLEIAITNVADTALSSIELDVMSNTSYRYMAPRERDSSWKAWSMRDGPGCVIDSILFRGVPCGREQVSVDNGVMVVDLDQPLNPGDKGHLLFSLTVRTESVAAADEGYITVWNDCWPRAIAFFVKGNRDDASAPLPIEPADWRAQIRVDSSYYLIHSGELRNEKELFGRVAQPDEGEVLRDVHENHPFTYQGKEYVPIFPEGIARYFLDVPAETDLVLVAGRNMARDLAAGSGRRYSVYYPRSRTASWERWVVADLKRLTTASAELLGWDPPAEMEAVVLPRVRRGGSESLIFLPGNDTRPEMRARLSAGLAGNGMRALEKGGALSEGAASLKRALAVVILYAAYGEDAAESISLLMSPTSKEPE